ncbi:MAG: hypothetical protein INR73_02220 [Williamsia sp.]|nr:hypothetical protein [Williamsia sp.]
MKLNLRPFYYYIKKKTQRTFSTQELAKKYRNACSKYEILGSRMIGLDTSGKRLIHLQLHMAGPTITEIEFSGVNSCTLKKQYGGIRAGGFKKDSLQLYLKTISLELRFKNGREAWCIPFYEKRRDKASWIPALEEKARTWQTLVSDRLLKGASL